MHTKGPWKATLIEASDDLKHTVKYPVYWKIEGPGTRGSYLASMNVYKSKTLKLKEAEANARLIAESPAMFDALRLVAAIVIDKYDAGDEALNDAWDAAREVLSRLEQIVSLPQP